MDQDLLSPCPQASLVHTTETIRIRYFIDLLMAKSWPVMLVGNAGTGKSVLMGDKLESLSTDDYLVQAVPFNFYTTSAMLQGEAGGRAATSAHYIHAAAPFPLSPHCRPFPWWEAPACGGCWRPVGAPGPAGSVHTSPKRHKG